MTDFLKSCPFCGGDADLDQSDDGLLHLKWAASCVHLGCPASHNFYIHDRKCEAIAAWNTRVEPQAGVDDAMVEKACKARWPHWWNVRGENREDCKRRMRRILTAALAPATGEGK